MPNDPITDNQRSGSITGIGIVLGFSLAFVSRFSFGSGHWNVLQFVALLVSGLGIVIQIRSLFRVLHLPAVTLSVHRAVRREFMVGAMMVLAGFVSHVLIDFVNDMGWKFR